MPVRTLLIALVFLLGGCANRADLFDFDGDGDPDSSDCAPSDPDSHFGADDPFGDGVDQNCDGRDGEDRDGDGYAASSGGGPDCDDTRDSVRPGATEVPDNDLDEDCDGVVLRCDQDGDGALSPVCGGTDCDDLDASCRTSADCADGDADGQRHCDGDCDDGDPDRRSGAVELCDGLDTDCSGDPGPDEGDTDADGALDCDDCAPLDARRAPTLPEICDGLDNDCDGSLAADEVDDDGDGDRACTDCDDDDATRESLDADGDGRDTCGVDECDDADPTRYVGAPDPPGDGPDQNCDGVDGVDSDGDGYAALLGDCDDTDPAMNGADEDNDGFSTCAGDCDDSNPALDPADADGDNFSTCEGDCDDLAPQAHPFAVEICDPYDTDCDPSTVVPGDGVDADGDGVAPCLDCDDANPARYPGAPEICDGLDDNCDGVTPVHGLAGEVDNDGDGYVDCAPWVGGGAILGGGDCADFVPTIHPGAFDDCDGIDTDCNGITDDLGDQDGDGVCFGDCDDNDPARWPGQWDVVGDGIDQDCDGTTSWTGLEWSDVMVEGSASGAGAGSAVALDGDVDGDGLADLLVGEPNWSSGAPGMGRACLFRGAELLAGADLSTGEAYACVQGVMYRDRIGEQVAYAGDIDGDGLDDVLVGGAYGGACNTSGARWGGVPVYLFLGATLAAGGTFETTDAYAVISPSGQCDRMGAGLAGAGDVDGDGLDDVLIGAPFRDVDGVLDVGSTFLLFGSTLSLGGTHPMPAGADVVFNGTVSGGEVGTSVAGGDIDADGFSDVVIGIPFGTSFGWGGAFLYYGALLQAGTTLDVGQAHVGLYGQGTQRTMGYSVAVLGDLTGDGLAEVAVGGPWSDGSLGAVAIVSGSTLLVPGAYPLTTTFALLDGVDSSGFFGWALGAGDVDGDAVPDLLVGHRQTARSEPASGGVDVYLGVDLAAGGLWTSVDGAVGFAGEGASAIAGHAVSGGDLDGDGFDDIAVGSPGWPDYFSTNTGTGRAYVSFGR